MFSQGVICLDILKTNWSPVQTIKTALLSIRMLLENPNPSDPQDAEVADMLMSEPHNFVKKAHGWAVTYADAPFQENLDLDRFNGLAREQPKSDDEAQYVPSNDLRLCESIQGKTNPKFVTGTVDTIRTWLQSSQIWALTLIKSRTHLSLLAFIPMTADTTPCQTLWWKILLRSC